MSAVTVDRQQVLRFRVRQQQLDRAPLGAPAATEPALLDAGVQDSGPDGAGWALAIRGAPPAAADDLALAWTLRGAPHAYRRDDLAAVAVATAPLDEADAARRIHDAAKPLAAAGIPVLEALRVVAAHLRDIVTSPTPKGEVSARLTERVGPAYLRDCRPCGATHVYETPFRLAALQAGLELEPGTSPPVLRRVPRLRPAAFGHAAGEAEPRFDVVRNHLRFHGPVAPGDVAAALDAPVAAVKAAWPPDAVAVAVTDAGDGRRPPARAVLAEDVDRLVAAAADAEPCVRLLAPFDAYLQLRDRSLLVADAARRRVLWPVLGRPGAVMVDGEVVGTWRPRSSGNRLTLVVDRWSPLAPATEAALGEQAERLAAHRGVGLAAITDA